MLQYWNRRRSSFERDFELSSEEEYFAIDNGKTIEKRRSIRIQKRLRIEASRRELLEITASDAYRAIRRGSKAFRLEQLRIIAHRSK